VTSGVAARRVTIYHPFMDPRPAIVQSDRCVLLEVDHPGYEAARRLLCRFAELEKSPEHVHTYRISALSLWNAASAGMTATDVIDGLASVSRFALPETIAREITELMGRHGLCRLENDQDGDDGYLVLQVADAKLAARFISDKKLGSLLMKRDEQLLLRRAHRGAVKQYVLGLGYPVDDRAGLIDGEKLELGLRLDAFSLYPYQESALRAFLDSGSHGVVVLPCGAGKTILGASVIAELQTRALVVTTSREACSQWRRELLARTTLTAAEIAIYSSDKKAMGAVTITTYGMLAQKGGSGPTGCRHFDLLAREPWGILIYDEVHLLPAPIFRLAAELQARRRLGLTATLVREDGRAGDVFALVGPKRYDVPWRDLEASGHIAAAACFELRIPLTDEARAEYNCASARERHQLAAENPEKLRIVGDLLERHAGDRVLVVGSYLDSLRACANAYSLPIVTGETPHSQREELYDGFRKGTVRRLALSRVGGLALDLPDANVLIQISGTMGSRQEEAQRLGRVLRPKPGGATFYTLVSFDTVEQESALHRQLFLTEQGYRYYIEDVRPVAEQGNERGGQTLH